MDFTTYKNSIYDDIQNDEMLKTFFEKLTLHSEKFYLLEIENQNREKPVEKPTLEKTLMIASKLKNKNINVKIEENQIDIYTTEYLFMNKMFDIGIKIEDLKFLKEKISFGFDAYCKTSPIEEKYLQFQIKHKKLVKTFQKILKYEKQGEYYYKPLTLDVCDKLCVYKDLEKRTQFINGLTEEQSKLLLELYEEMEDYKSKISNYRIKTYEREKKIFREGLFYEETLNYILDISLVNIDINTIIQNLFKILIINKLEPKETISEKLSFNTAIVDWFIKYKNEDLNKLYTQIFGNFSLTINDCIGKTKTKGGVT